MQTLVDRLVSLLTRVRSWVRASLHREDLDRVMNDELRFHIESYAEALEGRGLSPEEARRRARAEFGNLDASKEECREALGLRLLDEFRADLRYAVRLLRRSPAFTTVAVLSLGVGIGANTAIFTLVDKLLLSTIPVDDPWRLVEVNRTGPGGQGPVISYPTYRFLRDHNTVFTDIAVTGRIRRWSVLVPGGSEPERVAGELVSGNYFSLFGVPPALGRMLMPDDDVAGAGGHHGAVAVLSYEFWRRRLAANPAVLGQTLRIAGIPVTVVGVARSGFSGVEIADSVDLWVPVAFQPQLSLGQSSLDQAGDNWLRAIARLKPGVSREQARDASDAVFSQLPNADGQQILLDDAAYGLSTLRERVSFSLVLLMGAVVLVLLIACANVANLSLVRASRRQREVTLRVALGASRGRLVRQLLTESLFLSLAGGLLGLLIAQWTSRVLALLLMPANVLPVPLGLDARVLAFTLGLSILTSVVFGVAPALEGTRVDLAASSRQGSGTETRRTRKSSNALVVSQVALSVLLLIGAGLFAKTLRNLLAADTGFEQASVLVVRLDPLATVRSPSELRALHGQLLERTTTLPGVRAAALSDRVPLGGGVRQRGISVQGFVPKPEDDLNPYVVSVSPLFFETMGMRLIRGRAFTPADEPHASRLAIVNEGFARYYFGTDNAVGRRFGFGGPTESDQVEIVGVTQNSRLSDLREKAPHVVYSSRGHFVLRHRAGGAIRRGCAANGACGAPADPRCRSHAAGCERDHTQATGRAFSQQRAIYCACVDAVRDGGDISGVHRLVRSDRVLGESAHQRRRHSHGAWGVTRRCRAADSHREPDAGARRRRDRRTGRPDFHERDFIATVWRQRHRPVDVLGGYCPDGCDRRRRQLAAGAPGRARQSDGGASAGMKRRSASCSAVHLWSACQLVRRRSDATTNRSLS